MSFKNLRSPASNANATTPERVAPVPQIDDTRVNGDPTNESTDGAAPLRWGPPEPPEGPRPPMKLK